MPELPDVVVYIEALQARLLNQTLEGIRIASPFVLRSVAPAPSALIGRKVVAIRRLGKQIVFVFDAEHFLVLHLMIAGRLQWREPHASLTGKIGLAALDFSPGTLILTEAGSKKRASLHVVRGADSLAGFDRHALEVLDSSFDDFKAILLKENHTLKRSLTDPRLFSGIGNAYSDEILHHAQLSPMKQTARLSDQEIQQLWESTRTVLSEWVSRLRAQTGSEFPSKVTAFRPEMAVHGRFGKPCPRCGAAVQRIVYAENECNYCARCQTEGRLLADRAISRLLKQDWPRSLEEMEKHLDERRG
ncbi:MAG TPA: DNA-formamidopyrimidine glycosylase family protein [Terriglobia bacterium]|nr:DNA-formamidopyrimidine glycosylase family protein [Terriglobia bacterium]